MDPRNLKNHDFRRFKQLPFLKIKARSLFWCARMGFFFLNKIRISFWCARIFFLKKSGFSSLGSFGIPWGRLGLPPGVILQNWWRVVQNQTLCAKSDGRLFKIKFQRDVVSSQVSRIAAISTFSKLATRAMGATGAGEVVAGSAARTPHPTRAGGQDDGSYTNSLKLT